MDANEIKQEVNHNIGNAIFSLSFIVEDLKSGRRMNIVKDEKGSIVSCDVVDYTIDDAYQDIRENLKRISDTLQKINK